VIVRRHGLRLPRDLALLLTVLLVAEGLVAQLDPQFQFAEALAPYARRQLLAQLTPAAIRQRVGHFGADLAELAVDFPGRLDRLLKSVESGGLEVRLRADELESLLTRAERIGNRIAVAVFAAATIDGLAGLAVERRRRRRKSLAQQLGPEFGVAALVARRRRRRR
jgi:ubiquinone biosynthesis protein